jgi:hypothetical protein
LKNTCRSFTFSFDSAANVTFRDIFGDFTLHSCPP